MNKFFVLLTLMVSLAAAGVLDIQVIHDRSIERNDGQRIDRMTQEDLQRQKLLLDILSNIQMPLQLDELIRLDNGLIVDEHRYRGGIDEDMRHVIELDRQRRLIDEHQVYSIRDEEHVRQLRGIYRLLANALDWDTVQRNLVYLRRNINPVLLVNALVLVIRDRSDTQSLIMPAIPEILPGLCIDDQLISTAQHIGMNPLQTARPNLMDLVGLGHRIGQLHPVMHLMNPTQLWMPWREMRMQMAMKKAAQQGIQVGGVTVLNTKVDDGMALLTEDIGMRNFVQNLINEMAVQEGEMDHIRDVRNQWNERIVQGRMTGMNNIDNDDITRRHPWVGDDEVVERRERLERLRKGINMDVNQLPTTDINNGRLLHVSRRRLQQNGIDMESTNTLVNDRERFLRVLNNDDNDDDNDMRTRNVRVGLEHNISLGQPRMNLNQRRMDLEDDDDNVRGWINNGRENRMSDWTNTNDDIRVRNVLQGGRMNLNTNAMGVENLPTVDINSDRLLHVSRRRLNTIEQQQQQGGNIWPRGQRLSDGRRVVGDDIQNGQRSKHRQITDDDVRQRNVLGVLNNDDNDDDNDMRTRNVRVGLEHNIGLRLPGMNLNQRRMNLKDDDDNVRGWINNGRENKMSDWTNTNTMRGDRITNNDDDIRVRNVLRGGRMNLNTNEMGVENLPTVDINSDRLLHVSRRRLNTIEQQQQQRGNIWTRGQRLSDGRRVVDDNIQHGQRSKLGDWNDIRTMHDSEQKHRQIADDDVRHLNTNTDDRKLRNVDVEDRWNEEQNMHVPRRMESIGEGRRVGGGKLEDEDIMQLIRRDNRLNELTDDDIVQMIQRNRLNRITRMKQEQNNDDIDDDEVTHGQDRNSIQHGSRWRRSLDMDIMRDQINLRRNEILLHNLQQLVARLNQERISLGLPIDDIDMNTNINRLNNPRLVNNMEERYALRLNEMRLDSRRMRVVLDQINDIERRLEMVIGQHVDQIGMERVQLNDQREVDRRIADVIMGRLGHVGILRIIRELLTDSVESVGQVDRLGLGVKLNHPVLQHLLRRIVNIVDKQRVQLLGTYRREDLSMDGVTVNDVRVDKLRTRIDTNDLDLINLLQRQQLEEQKTVVARQHRLNNKQFNIDMDITADRAQRVVIRMLLGPRTDAMGRELTLDERRTHFTVLDTMVTELKTGRNRIVRRSNDIAWTTRDTTPFTEIYRRVMLALRGQLQGDVSEVVGENGRLPQRLLLPRGRVDGLPMQLLVIVSPVIDERMDNTVNNGLVGMGSVNVDSRPLGYPLDRRIDNERELLELSNIQMQNVMIVHENVVN